MARTKYTVSFPAAKAGDEVTWPNTVKVYPDANTVQPLGNGYIEAAGGSFIGWSDATSVTFTRAGTDAVTVTSASPTGTGAAASSNAASGASTGTTIGLATPALDGLSVDIAIASVWGIDGSGNPYYNAVGAAPGEAAILDVNAATGELVICQPNGVVPL